MAKERADASSISSSSGGASANFSVEALSRSRHHDPPRNATTVVVVEERDTNRANTLTNVSAFIM